MAHLGVSLICRGPVGANVIAESGRHLDEYDMWAGAEAESHRGSKMREPLKRFEEIQYPVPSRLNDIIILT